MSDTQEKTIQTEQAPENAAQQAQTAAQTPQSKDEKKQARKRRREERRAAYRALSGGKKLLRWIKWSLLGLAALALLYFIGSQLFTACMTRYMQSKYAQSLTAQAPREAILFAAPEDTEGAASVAATPAFDPDDTWVVYLYMCGSDLESMGRNKLSDTTAYYVDRERTAYAAQQSEAMQRRFHTFIDEMRQEGMSLPDYLFLPASRETSRGGEGGGASDMEGYATKNLRNMFSVELPENVSVVVQTGGAYDWILTQVNPNASQRFLYDQNGFTELSSTYPQNMGSVETLADFLRYAQAEHSADHAMLLFWNHGSGPFGFCSDEIYAGDCLTLAEMREALETVYGDAPAAPPFELVGYDACLMASTEVAEALHGYTRYLAASEETEMGDGWAYDKWLAALAAHPEMNGAQLGKVITDTFVEACANFSINMQWLNMEAVATFSVIDVDKAHDVYQAYTRLCAAALKDTAQHPWPLAAWGRAAGKSIRYAGSYYKYCNTIDLGVFMRNLAPDYPQETGDVLDALGDAVLYHRETSYTQGSEGLSLYFPTDVDSFIGLTHYLEYMDTVCTDPDMRTFYYYKVAGCLSEELQAYAKTAGYGAFDTLDTTPLDALAAAELSVCEDNTVELPISNEVATLMQDMTVCVAKYDASADELCFYGDDACLYLDEYRTLHTTFDGSWAMLDGHVLPLEIIDRTDAFMRYRVPIEYDGSENAYLVLARELKSGAYSILGVQNMDEDADTLGRNLKPVEIGSRMAIRYRMESMASETIREEYGDRFVFRPNSKVENAALKNGAYYMIVSITDTRGDSYYPPLVSFHMENGAVKDMEVSEELGAMASAE